MQNYASDKDGKCLSEAYNGLAKLLEWECQFGHKWSSRPQNMIYDSGWCPVCGKLRSIASRRLDEDTVKVTLKSKGFVLLSTYQSVDKDIEVLHEICQTKIVAGYRVIIKGNPCFNCNGKMELTEDVARKYAESKGGKLVSWGGLAKANSKFQCQEGHLFSCAWSRMRIANSWCGRCWQRFSKTRSTDSNRLASKSLWSYKRTDKKKGLECNLTHEDVLLAKSSKCFYCDRPATGFDRIDNSIGHVKANCVPACIRCNWTRGDFLSHEVMVQIGELLKKIDP